MRVNHALVFWLAMGSWLSPYLPAGAPPPPGLVEPLFDGRTLAGWEGDVSSWRVEDGAMKGGPLGEDAPQSELLCTAREFANFILRLEFKVAGSAGASAGGIQIRSRRIPGSSGRAGYRCGLGDPDRWGALHDEGRRDRVLFPGDGLALGALLRRDEWNQYVIRADGPRLTLWINGLETADYHEEDAGIPERGAVAIHAPRGAGARLELRDITLEELPPTPPEARFIGAPAPGPARSPSPLTPDEERASFTLPPDFAIELIASEIEGAGKPITVAWDAAGRLWTMTALEYPVDANDDAGAAEDLYRRPRRDQVLVFDDPYGPGPHLPRVFADGLAIPLGLLPYRDGAFVQHGPDILFLEDTDGDGRADRRQVVLTGFGIGDSHLMPHQFTRAPGGWVLFAQGAFNNSLVRAKLGGAVEFNRTLLGRFTLDGNKVETIGWGPCNIWGLVLGREGEVFIQEANDYGYPVVPFHVGACYPGCTPFPKPYAPRFPNSSRLGFGGTGLSGLALSDEAGHGWPPAYAGVFYVANPVTQRVQAAKLSRDGPRYALVKLPDFLRSADEWFRPVAIHFGPDGCLYVVDWYNKVISHNEVPRNHADRDKSRGRIWRVRHRDQKRRAPVDFTSLADADLLDHFGDDSLWRSHTAWQQVIDRGALSLVPALEAMAADPRAKDAARIPALWALEGLKRAGPGLLRRLLGDPSRNLRREATRVFGAGAFVAADFLDAVEPLADDPDPEVRAEVLRSAALLVGREERALILVARMGREALPGPLARSTHDGGPVKVREAYDRDFERYLVRSALEKHAGAVARFLKTEEARLLPLESRLLAALALEPRESAALVAVLVPGLGRAPNEEELLRLAGSSDQPGVRAALKAVLENPVTSRGAAEALLRGRTRFDTALLRPLLAASALALMDGDQAAEDLALRLASGFRLQAAEPRLAAALDRPGLPAARPASLLRVLREIGSGRTELFARLAADSSDPSVRQEALAALATAPPAEAAGRLFALWPRLDPAERRAALDRFASSKAGAEALVEAARTGELPGSDIDAPLLERILLLCGDHPGIEDLLDGLGAVARQVLRLDGRRESYVDSDMTLVGPFTVETWVRLDPGIGNDDGILGRPGGAGFNFHAGFFRVYAGPEHGDRIVAGRKMTAGLWTHVAVTRDADGNFRIYLDGEPDAAESKPLGETFTDLDIGRLAVPPGGAQGTGALLAEFRAWDRCRSSGEIRADFDRSFETKPAGLVHHFPGGGPWGKLNGTACVVRTVDAPPVLTAAEAELQAARLERFRALAERPGEPARGRQLAASACQTCHAIQGQGVQIGPNLSGAGAMSLEALLRALVTPNAAMEAGYRVFRVELKTDEVLDAFLVSEDKDAVILRMPSREDRRIERGDILRASFLRRSLMPEGLLEALPERDITDLFSYLRTLNGG